MTVEEFQRDLEGAVSTAESYWQSRVDGFDPVNDIVPYMRGGEVSCGGQGIPDNNAAYCPAGDFIAYDADWAVAAFRRLGDAFLFYLLGHEYAHAIQVQIGAQHEFAIQTELQADCMAGAYIGDSVRSKALTLEEGDLDELRNGLIAVGDDPGQPWFAPEAHGTPEQRTQAFFNGYESSLGACAL
jgi:predicted metalloprotease